MESIKVLLGKRIKELRKERSLTQEALAELIGIDTRNLIKIENGQTFLRAATLDKLVEIFEVTPDEIFRTEHLKNIDTLKQKIIKKLDEDAKLVKLIYKMLF